MSENQLESVKQENTAPAKANEQSVLPLAWVYKRSESMENVRRARAMFNTKYGIYSGVPMLCQGSRCPFRKTCWIPENELEIGQRCPIEVAAIMERFEAYCRELNVGDEDTVDHSIIKDIIDIEIMMLRADNLLAVSGNFIEEVVAAIDQQGNVYTKPEVHKALEVKMKLRQERIKLLNQLNSTRKDKKETAAGPSDPSTQAAMLIQTLRRLEAEGKLRDVVIDVDPEDIREVSEGQ